MRWSRMSCGSVDASTLPLTWNCVAPLPVKVVTATLEFIPSPTYFTSTWPSQVTMYRP
jgi:hypothetical protein